ncbi:MAG: aminopeptidase N [Pseudomonadota bacterium]
MRPNSAPTIRLADYAEPPFWIKETHLEFYLHPTATRVRSKIIFAANENRTDGPHQLRLDGRGLDLKSASINRTKLTDEQILIDEEGLTIPADLVPQDGFTWEAEVEINPKANTALEGLYMSNGMYCTQCEAQGFRKITYYLDRPDVMAEFFVTMNGDQPVRLSNGNPNDKGTWHDPWVKPAYLFALVAGDLVSYEDSFTTMSGRKVDLQIFVRPGDEGKCAYAMDALKRSMTWDEEVYGREYDLDLFMIVAVDDFNMGAMENKGLNIFNSKYVLASPETATDNDYELIEGIIAHEYFHNWTGNRITCRDWFQLCLKEGLTVFRDQQFSGDMRSHAVKRIDDVSLLRGRQFREDAGPLAHPVRPEEYIEINNFYTATVYEKGAEVIGMLKTLVGDAGYKKALDLYFARHDGQACTIEHWLKVFEDACDIDLTQFKLWYSQSGTPKVTVDQSFAGDTLTLTLTQDANPSENRKGKKPQVIPIRTGFLGKDGSEIAEERLLLLTEKSQSFEVSGLPEHPTLSLNRRFSAPIIIDAYEGDTDARAHLFTHDTDPFVKWEAGFNMQMALLSDAATGTQIDPSAYIAAIGKTISDTTLDPAFRNWMIGLPSEDAIAQNIVDTDRVPDPATIHSTYQRLKAGTATVLLDDLIALYDANQTPGTYDPRAEDAGKRALKNACLHLITMRDMGARATHQFETADNMTDQIAALSALIRINAGADAVASFYDQWKDTKLVIDKWFGIQMLVGGSDALITAKALTEHAEFNWQNPNRFRALIGAFAATHSAFHAPGGYDFIADWLIKLDDKNPQTTARMCGVFETWKRYAPARQDQMNAAMDRIRSKKNLSKDAAEILGKIIG